MNSVVTSHLETKLHLAVEVAKEAAELIIGLRDRKEIELFFKDDNSPVTSADRASEKLIRARLLGTFPTDGFVGEELEPVKGTSGLVWSCDPIDGTWSYLNHEITCTICIGLHRDNETLLAVVYNPFTHQLYTGYKNGGAAMNDKKLPLVEKYSLDRAVVNFVVSRTKMQDVDRLYDLRNSGKLSKLLSLGGSIAYSLAQVSSGAHNVFVGNTAKPSNLWDLAGGIFLIRQSGGVVTNLQGVDLNTVKSDEVLVASSNPTIHAEALKALNEINFGK